MKNFVLGFCLVLLAATSGFAQTYTEIPFVSKATGTAIGLVTNTGSDSLSIPKTVGHWSVAAVNVVVNKLTGTAAGVVRLFGSIDGINYYRVNPTDSLNVTNVARTGRIFVLTGYPYAYLRLTYTGSGTMTANVSGKALFKRSQ